MLSIAALGLAAASAATSPPLMPTSSWWEKITVTYDSSGSQRSCSYETSFTGGPEGCDDLKIDAGLAKTAAGGAIQTKITFERRFTPGAAPDFQKLDAGDTLLGGHVMMVAVGRDGAVRGCSIIAASRGATPDYGCDEVRAERFQASTREARDESQVGFLTVLVYGHQEDVA